MQVEDRRSQILRSSNWTRENQDRRDKDKRSIGLASPKRSQGYTEVFRTSELLLVVY